MCAPVSPLLLKVTSSVGLAEDMISIFEPIAPKRVLGVSMLIGDSLDSSQSEIEIKKERGSY